MVEFNPNPGVQIVQDSFRRPQGWYYRLALGHHGIHWRKLLGMSA
jgi:hypothetical protein